jgi:CheY-like chemotaxis protein
MELLPMRELIDQAIRLTRSLAEEKKLELERDVAPELPLINGDRDRLLQVLINLISNAIKFTDTGKVILQVRVRGERLEVQVRDTGMGIAMADVSRIFDKFTQVGGVLTNKPDGTGLGLAICRQIIEHHGGFIGVESVPGAGSLFFFTLPIASGEEILPTDVVADEDLVTRLNGLSNEILDDPRPREKRTILVADDNDFVRDFVKFYLEEWGYDVLEATGGREALRLVRERPVDLLLLDIVMDDMDGREVAEEIRKNDRLLTLPIVVLSSNQEPEWMARLSIAAFFPKPVEVDTLKREIHRLLFPLVGARRILIAVDDAGRLKRISDLLNLNGFETIFTMTANDAIRQTGAANPDLVVLSNRLAGRGDLLRHLKVLREKGGYCPRWLIMK